MQEFTLLKNIVLGSRGEFLFKHQKTFLLESEDENEKDDNFFELKKSLTKGKIFDPITKMEKLNKTYRELGKIVRKSQISTLE